MANPNRAGKSAAALEALTKALREHEALGRGHDEYYRYVILPIEEVGIRCDGCHSAIDAADVLDMMVREEALGPRGTGPVAVLATGWECTWCAGGAR